ncbi:hypothetical protein [Kineosporia babensis]|uniref:Alpha-xenorhabdolysin family binary toxin subunit A n=1 Tax=Kineosporia babensis TaxID=499548 RepID=A0A9X1NMQ3_9ACTN|nr:hypothetical protein [Kineosporia babensis]MCD5317003.1 hypothetical protein [Kineosporia babensis]
MSDELERINDGEGLAVVGPPSVVDRLLREAGLLAKSVDLGLSRLGDLLGHGSTVIQGMAEISANSGRYLKIDAETAERIAKFGLIKTDTPGVSWAMIGSPGDIASWIKVQTDVGSLLTNPAVLGGISGMMDQAASQQQLKEIAAALARLDEKVDTILKRQDDAVLSDLIGVGAALDLETRIRNESLKVSDSAWATVSQSLQKVEAGRAIAQSRIHECTERWAKAAGASSIGWSGFGTAKQLTKELEAEEKALRNWLAVLIRCAEMDHKFFLLRLERALAEAPEHVEGCRRAIAEHQTEREAALAENISKSFENVNTARQKANAWMILDRTRSLVVIESANRLAAELDQFCQLLQFTVEERSWETRELGRAARLSAQTVQAAKDYGPIAGALGVAALLVQKTSGDGEGTAT